MRGPALKILAVAVVLLGAVLVGPTPAHAGVGCYAGSCTGQDPVQMGCSADATTLDSNGPIELRFSQACWAVWVRSSDTNYEWRGIVEGFTNPCAPQSYPSCWPAASEYTPWGGGWSNMVSYVYWVRACNTDIYGILYEATCTAEH